MKNTGNIVSSTQPRATVLHFRIVLQLALMIELPKNVILTGRVIITTILSAALIYLLFMRFVPEMDYNSGVDNMSEFRRNLIDIRVWAAALLLGILEGYRFWKTSKDESPPLSL